MPAKRPGRTPASSRPRLALARRAKSLAGFTLKPGWRPWTLAMICLGVNFWALDNGIKKGVAVQKTAKAIADLAIAQGNAQCLDSRKFAGFQIVDLQRRGKIQVAESRDPSVPPWARKYALENGNSLKAAAGNYQNYKPAVCPAPPPIVAPIRIPRQRVSVPAPTHHGH